MTLKARINEDVKTAMRAREAKTLGTLRLLLAAIKQREVDERIELDDSAIISVIDRMLKQRRDSISQFAAAGRDELADAERFESELLSSYLPAGLSADEVSAAIAQAIADANAAGPGDMGRVMNKLRGGLAGRADMGEVSRLVKMRLAGA
ncbi:GatB/YqeY domain-containing protein [Accumulibacter sp.]|uniref:GatB/YqeY domain-containing protein n=1 Tax=Accumulibacter sp. TaxID=2053492 RepID=UPI001D5FD8DA|nr:GatB/YqeY domain-containing protein [Accumulibacter sp.]MCB1933536.1 GatB/YqeY domain-containing protein [Accumulibacter sp.]MCB1966640.1 GatB/YqeY domain-containing protein [Accumulibacter sp.]MCP5227763.1 GatB/YqeY domain-containing protein [Accumulibacter sp.]